MMQPVQNILVICTFIIMGIGFAMTILRLILNEGSFLGSPSINPFLFYSGKISIFFCWGLTLIKAIIPTFGWVIVPAWLSWFGACLLVVGTIVLLLSFYELGASLRYGIPEKDTQLKMTGLYRFSRHPLYLGVFLVTLSCIIFFPNPLNIIIGLYSITTHYMMLLGEEKYLTKRFGTEWESYKNRVRRII